MLANSRCDNPAANRSSRSRRPRLLTMHHCCVLPQRSSPSGTDTAGWPSARRSPSTSTGVVLETRRLACIVVTRRTRRYQALPLPPDPCRQGRLTRDLPRDDRVTSEPVSERSVQFKGFRVVVQVPDEVGRMVRRVVGHQDSSPPPAGLVVGPTPHVTYEARDPAYGIPLIQERIDWRLAH